MAMKLEWVIIWIYLKEREAVRTPMQWSAEEGAGFSKAPKLVHPLVTDGFFSYKHVNVEDQRRDPASMLNWMTSLIRLRKECPEIGYGDWEIIKTGHNHVLGMLYKWQGRSLVVFHNFDEHPHEIVISTKQVGDELLIDLINNEESKAEKSKHHIILDAFGYRWFRIGSFDHFQL